MNRQKFKLIIVLFLSLFLSIGYAVVNSVSLSITGSAAAGTETLDVYFTGRTEVSNSTKATASAVSNGTTATASISNMVLNETITLEYQIYNNEIDVDAELIVTLPTSNDYFAVSISEGSISSGGGAGHPTPQSDVFDSGYDIVYLADPSTGGHGGNTNTYHIGASDYFVLMVTVKLIKTPVTSSDSTFEFNVDITANPVTI